MPLKRLSLESLAKCFATRELLRRHYLDVLIARDANPEKSELRECAHKLFSALVDLDRLLDDELGQPKEIKDALLRGHDAVEEMREARRAAA